MEAGTIVFRVEFGRSDQGFHQPTVPIVAQNVYIRWWDVGSIEQHLFKKHGFGDKKNEELPQTSQFETQVDLAVLRKRGRLGLNRCTGYSGTLWENRYPSLHPVHRVKAAF